MQPAADRPQHNLTVCSDTGGALRTVFGRRFVVHRFRCPQCKLVTTMKGLSAVCNGRRIKIKTKHHEKLMLRAALAERGA